MSAGKLMWAVIAPDGFIRFVRDTKSTAKWLCAIHDRVVRVRIQEVKPKRKARGRANA